ncbi:MAG: hypothetical protein LBG89_00305 [Rickettsiales bacterium]|jgi:hypothetical protein|nr:hypothetical protein [Rickettsiales bacterium]
MIAVCPVCHLSYEIKKPSARARCAACSCVFGASRKKVSAAAKLVSAALMFSFLLFGIFAASLYLERKAAAPDMVVAITSAAPAGHSMAIKGKITNRTDSMRPVPKIIAVMTDADSAVERIGFFAPSPLLIGGESIEFFEKINYTIANPVKITLEFSDED